MKRPEANAALPTVVLPYYASGQANEPLHTCPPGNGLSRPYGCGHVFREQVDAQGCVMCPNCGTTFPADDDTPDDVKHFACPCGEQHRYGGGDVRCQCGTEYNSFGQQLRPGWSWDDDGRDLMGPEDYE